MKGRIATITLLVVIGAWCIWQADRLRADPPRLESASTDARPLLHPTAENLFGKMDLPYEGLGRVVVHDDWLDIEACGIEFGIRGSNLTPESIVGDMTIEYDQSTGILRLVVSEGDNILDKSFQVDFAIDPPVNVRDNCPGGTCSCGDGRCSSCCSTGYHPRCRDCRRNSESCTCVKNAAGMEVSEHIPEEIPQQ